MRIGKGAPQGTGIRGNDDDMNMIRYQAVTPDFSLGFARICGHPLVTLITLTGKRLKSIRMKTC